MKYDVIGDVHGQASLLKKLLSALGYQIDLTGTFYHPIRKAIFVGDIINKGPEIKETVQIVRQMVQGGYAEMVIGNHEWAWLNGNLIGVSSTLNAYGLDTVNLAADLEWIKSLPFYIEKDGLRVVHAFWDKQSVHSILKADNPTSYSYYSYSTDFRKAAILLVNGPYYKVSPEERIMQNEKQKSRLRFRWWSMDIPLYSKEAKPLFFGHYCLEHEPGIIQSNVCCLDFCVHRTGRLAAYRWEGETILRNKNLIIVSDDSSES